MINKKIELKKYPILAMNQIEKYIDDYYDSIIRKLFIVFIVTN